MVGNPATFDDYIPDFPSPGLNFGEIILTNPWADFRYRNGASFCPTTRECERPNVCFHVKSTDGEDFNNGLVSATGKPLNALYATCLIKRKNNDPLDAVKVVFDVIHPVQPDRYLFAAYDESFLVPPLNPTGNVSEYGTLYARMQYSFKKWLPGPGQDRRANPCPEIALKFSSPFITGSQIVCKNINFQSCSPWPEENARFVDLGCVRNLTGNTIYRINPEASRNCVLTFSDVF